MNAPPAWSAATDKPLFSLAEAGKARGQVIVSSLWALCGLGLVVAGLHRGRSGWRSAGLVLLGLAAAKITIFDLASLSTAARTISFIVVGMVFLAAAFAYQAMLKRPER